jgi:tetratricopeptide (TPR) repeat protein
VKGDDNRAIADFTKAIRINPKFALAYRGRGEAQYRKGDFDGAIADLNKVIDLAPNSALADGAFAARGAAKQQKGNTAGAIADYTAAIQLNPKCAHAYDGRASARYAKGDFDGAIADCTEGIRLNPKNVWSYTMRALAKERKGDKERAQADRNEAQRLREGGKPAGDESQIVALADAFRSNPKLEDLLKAGDPSVAVARWRNRTLVEAKNTLLPNLLRDSKTRELSGLVTKIEQLILDLSHESEVAKDRAQQAVEKGSGTAAGHRELSLIYKERIEVLKPILAAIKEEIANRSK